MEGWGPPMSENKTKIIIIIIIVMMMRLTTKTIKSESMRAPGSAATWHLADFHETLPV